MKKKNILGLMILCLFVGGVTACNSNQENEDIKEKLELDYIKDLQFMNTNCTAFGIRKESYEDMNNIPSEDVEPLNQKDDSFIHFNRMVKKKNDTPHSSKNYLYQTFQEYEDNNVEYAINSVEKVTFKKNSSKKENVHDDKGNLIDSDSIITQDNISGQINRLYVSGKYIFMQFIPLVYESTGYGYYEDGELLYEYVEVRPTSLIYNSKGVSDFDIKANNYNEPIYYSSALSQSFVVDIATGYIYKIEKIRITSIVDNDLVEDENHNIYKMSINSKGELSFKDVLPNKDIALYNAITDKYGYTFVYNDSINQIDSENKIVYYKRDEDKHYVIDDKKNVYIFAYEPNTLMDAIGQIFVDGTFQPVDNEVNCYGLKTMEYSSNFSWDYGGPIGYYKGKRIYDFNLYTPEGIIGIEDSLAIIENGRSYTWLDQHTIIMNTYEASKLKYYIVDFEDFYNQNKKIQEEDFTILSDELLHKCEANYAVKIGNDRIEIENVYYQTTLAGTTYYQLIRNGNKLELKRLEDKSYEQNVFIFQPINL